MSVYIAFKLILCYIALSNLVAGLVLMFLKPPQSESKRKRLLVGTLGLVLVIISVMLLVQSDRLLESVM